MTVQSASWIADEGPAEQQDEEDNEKTVAPPIMSDEDIDVTSAKVEKDKVQEKENKTESEQETKSDGETKIENIAKDNAASVEKT